jgi:hypothetical protein
VQALLEVEREFKAARQARECAEEQLQAPRATLQEPCSGEAARLEAGLLPMQWGAQRSEDAHICSGVLQWQGSRDGGRAQRDVHTSSSAARTSGQGRARAVLLKRRAQGGLVLAEGGATVATDECGSAWLRLWRAYRRAMCSQAQRRLVGTQGTTPNAAFHEVCSAKPLLVSPHRVR